MLYFFHDNRVFATKIIILILKEATMTNLVIVLVSKLSLFFFI